MADIHKDRGAVCDEKETDVQDEREEHGTRVPELCRQGEEPQKPRPVPCLDRIREGGQDKPAVEIMSTLIDREEPL